MEFDSCVPHHDRLARSLDFIELQPDFIGDYPRASLYSAVGLPGVEFDFIELQPDFIGDDPRASLHPAVGYPAWSSISSNST